MEERVVRNDEVRGSIPLGSTRMKKAGCHAGLFRRHMTALRRGFPAGRKPEPCKKTGAAR